MFKFPVNYAEPHSFGKLSEGRFSTIYNDSDVKVPYGFQITVNGTSTNPTVTNLLTFEFLRINGSFGAGYIIDVYRDENNVLRANLTDSDGNVTDIISMIDDESTFYELSVGDNLVSINDDEGGVGMSSTVSFKPVVVALYES